MRDTLVTMRAGEKRPVYGTVTAPSGTITFSAPPTATLRDNGGNVLAAVIAVTGYDIVAAEQMRAWLDLDTANPPGSGGPLAIGAYTLQFTMPFVATADGITRLDEPVVLVCVVD